MPAGHNGPWKDEESPLRNTGNWLQVFGRAYELTGNRRLKGAVEAAARYMLDPVHRPGGTVFLHRVRAGKPDGNGLIGQAWTVLGLLEAFRLLGWEELRSAAEKVIVSHPFDPLLALWSSQALTGQPLGVNITLNQQIWFAVSCEALPGTGDDVPARVSAFLSKLPRYLQTLRGGLLTHLISPWRLSRRFPSGMRSSLRARVSGRFRPLALAVGYQSFALQGLAALHLSRPDEPIWTSRALLSALAFAASEAFRQRLAENRLAYGYNPTGLEMACSVLNLGPSSGWTAEEWLEEQFRRTFDFDAWQMSRNTDDPPTLAGRLCEAVRLPNLRLRLA